MRASAPHLHSHLAPAPSTPAESSRQGIEVRVSTHPHLAPLQNLTNRVSSCERPGTRTWHSCRTIPTGYRGASADPHAPRTPAGSSDRVPSCEYPNLGPLQKMRSIQYALQASQPVYLGFCKQDKMGFCRHPRSGYSHLQPLQNLLTGYRGASADPPTPRTLAGSSRQDIELRASWHTHLTSLQKLRDRITSRGRLCKEEQA